MNDADTEPLSCSRIGDFNFHSFIPNESFFLPIDPCQPPSLPLSTDVLVIDLKARFVTNLYFEGDGYDW
ncbi:hypothetical protein FHS14_002188 [Paenibacillus baekrokdamisoli]|nr:hypothetical protein [Paenibacillus baekrokdamisoli]